MPTSLNRRARPLATSALIARLLDPEAYPHTVERLTCVETHISWVMLTGEFAYKIKKPVALEFLDFSTLPLRRAACLDELRLNRRLAPMLYVDVVPIAGPVGRAMIRGAGEPIEYAVRMHQFPQADQLDRLLEAGRLEESDISRVAQRIALFHADAPRVTENGNYGTPDSIRHIVDETLHALQTLLADAAQRKLLETLSTWSSKRFDALKTTFAARRRQRLVRECHGDLHLGNLVRLHDEVVPFDCIEFSPELRWIDVISDIAFLMMDLLCRSRIQLAYRLINRYLETSGDYAGVAVLRYYMVYRALVRTMVASLRRAQLAQDDAQVATAVYDATSHLELARSLAAPPPALLFLMHGLSGSGKTHVSEELMQRWPAIRVRSDVERKRLHGYGANATTRSALGADVYSHASDEATYERLFESAKTALIAGFSVIVDAAFLQLRRRNDFRALAAANGVDFIIIDCVAPVNELRHRLQQRNACGGDASEAGEVVLDDQLRHAEPLQAAELADAVAVDPQVAGDPATLVVNLAKRPRQRA